jgi:hypothetical protein
MNYLALILFSAKIFVYDAGFQQTWRPGGASARAIQGRGGHIYTKEYYSSVFITYVTSHVGGKHSYLKINNY